MRAYFWNNTPHATGLDRWIVNGRWLLAICTLSALIGCGSGGGSERPDAEAPDAELQGLCSDTCMYANDDVCDDGGPGSTYDDCAFGTDCADCGRRTPEPARDCVVGDCDMGLAASCDGELFVACLDYGASCVDQSDPVGFRWCDCGQFSAGQGACTDASTGVVCDEGILKVADCLAGSVCDDTGDILNCYCDDIEDGVCPAAVCTADPDCNGCTPTCGTDVCGDNGCQGTCGSCPLGQQCSAGSCVASCTGDCTGRECGFDGCEESCGTCTSPDTCNTSSGLCESSCVPSCEPGQACGSNGCAGGTCGSPCPSDRTCSKCPNGGACAEQGYACRCPFFERVSYMFDASGVNWTDTNFVDVRVTHINLDGTRRSPTNVYLRQSTNTDTIQRLGCVHHAEVRRRYSMRGAVYCEETDIIMTGSVTIPSAVLSGQTCAAPSL